MKVVDVHDKPRRAPRVPHGAARGLGSNGTENRDKNEKSLRIIVFRIDHVLIFAWIDGVCGPQSTDSLRPLRGLPLIEAPKSGH